MCTWLRPGSSSLLSSVNIVGIDQSFASRLLWSGYPTAVAGMELQSLAIDLLTVIEQLAKGVGRVEERPGPEQAVMGSHEHMPVGCQKPSWCTQSLPSK